MTVPQLSRRGRPDGLSAPREHPDVQVQSQYPGNITEYVHCIIGPVIAGLLTC